MSKTKRKFTCVEGVKNNKPVYNVTFEPGYNPLKLIIDNAGELKLSLAEVCVLSKLIWADVPDFDMRKGYCFLKTETIAISLGITTQYVNGRLRSLEQKGFIKIDRRRRNNGTKCTSYYYIYPCYYKLQELCDGGKGSRNIIEEASNNTEDITVAIQQQNVMPVKHWYDNMNLD
ncbi:MAG: hypothetical protein PHT33_10325 [bacterium]|nr:hypothetical protein [bacterium]